MTIQRLIRGLALLAFVLLLQACGAKTSKQVAVDLWRDWEQMDTLLQINYSDQVPIVLVHGWNGGEFTWPSPARLMQLEQSLDRDIFFFTYRSGIVANRYPPIEIMEEHLARFLQSFQRVDIVAHSMGGLLVRQYLAHHRENPVRRLVFLSTPHFGSNVAKILTGVASVSAMGNIQAEEIQPGSDFLWRLNRLAGAELEGREVLNVYAGGQSWLKSDLVVDPGSAYLPWAYNVKVEGDHHTLASHLTDFDWILDFLNYGLLPPEAQPPKRRDIWLRFQRKDGTWLHFSDAHFHRLDAKGLPRTGGFVICCDQRSSLHSEFARTVVLEDAQADEVFEITIGGGAGTATLDARDLLDSGVPVSLIIKSVETPAGKSDQPVGMP